MAKPDGGPAFPNIGYEAHQAGIDRVYEKGLSLRDYFAIHILAGILANPHRAADNQAQYAGMAYRQADAMLAEREK